MPTLPAELRSRPTTCRSIEKTAYSISSALLQVASPAFVMVYPLVLRSNNLGSNAAFEQRDAPAHDCDSQIEPSSRTDEVARKASTSPKTRAPGQGNRPPVTKSLS
jgi:hypothetical protein